MEKMYKGLESKWTASKKWEGCVRGSCKKKYVAVCGRQQRGNCSVFSFFYSKQADILKRDIWIFLNKDASLVWLTRSGYHIMNFPRSDTFGCQYGCYLHIWSFCFCLGKDTQQNGYWECGQYKTWTVLGKCVYPVSKWKICSALLWKVRTEKIVTDSEKHRVRGIPVHAVDWPKFS